MKKKRMRALLLAASVVTGVLVGCGNPGEKATEASTQGATNAPAATNAPVASEKTEVELPRKLTIGIQTDALVTDYENNALTQMLEEMLDCELEMMLLPSDASEVLTKLGLMVNSPEQMPDVIITTALSNEAVYEYGSKGAFIDLSEYVNEEDMPNFFNIPEDDRAIMLNGMTSADGGVYSMVSYTPGTPWNTAADRMWINQAWLDKLGLETPKTTDDLYNVLKAFKEKDPNGNGIADEVIGYGIVNKTGGNLPRSLMNSFIYFADDLALDEAGENVIAPFIMEEYKEGLKYLHKLYSEGLINPGLYTDTTDQLKAYANAEVNVLGFVGTNSHSHWTSAANNPNFQEMKVLAPLEGPEGVSYTVYTPGTPAQIFFVTSQCENVELAVELGDVFYEHTVTYASRYGLEGEEWTTDPEVLSQYSHAYIETGFFETPPVVIYKNIWPEQTDRYWRGKNPRYTVSEFSPLAIEENLKGNFTYTATTQATADHVLTYYGKWPEHVLSKNLKYTAEEQETLAEVKTLIIDYVKQSMAEFVTGVMDVDKDWDSYLGELEAMGLEEFIKITQASHDREK